MAFEEFTGELDAPANGGRFETFTGELDTPTKPETNAEPYISYADPMGGGGAEIMAAAKPKRESVLEGIQLLEPKFDEAQALRMSTRAGAERELLPGDPRLTAPVMRAPTGKTIRPSESGVLGRAGQMAGAAAGGAAAGAIRLGSEIAGAAGAKKVSSALQRAAKGTREIAEERGLSAAMTGEIAQGDITLSGLNQFTEKYAPQILAQLPQMAATMATGGITLPLMLTGLAAYDDARERGIDPVNSVAYALGQGTAEAVGEKLGGMSRLANAFETTVKAGFGRNAVSRLGQAMVSAGAREVPSEELTYAAQFAIDKLAGINPEAGIKEFLEGAKETAIVAAGAGGIVGGGGAALSRTAGRGQPSITTAEQMARARGFLVPEPTPSIDPIMAIAGARSVDEAIVAAQNAVQSSTAVENIAEILRQNQPQAQLEREPAATETVAGLAPDVAQTTQAIAELEAADVRPSSDVPSVPATPTGRGLPEPGVGVETGLGTGAVAGPAVDTGGVRAEPAGVVVSPVSRADAGAIKLYSQMNQQELEDAYASALKTNDELDISAVRKHMGDAAANDFAKLNRRAKDKWMDKNASEVLEDDSSTFKGIDADAIRAHIVAVNDYDTESATALGRSIALKTKNIDRPDYQQSPDYTSVKNALAYAKSQGWSESEVLDGMRSRAAQWAGSDAAEIFGRLFSSAKTTTTNVQNQAQARLSAQGQAAPTETPAPAGRVGVQTAAARAQARGAAVQAARVDQRLVPVLQRTPASPVPAAQEPAPAMRATQGKQVSFYPGKYGKGMGKEAAKLEAQRLNRVSTDKTITYAAEEHNDPKLENPYAVVGRKVIPPQKQAKAQATREQVATETIAEEMPEKAAPAAAPKFSRAAPEPASAAQQATEILDAAGLTGKDRIDAMKDVKAGTITPDELKAAYPAKAATEQIAMSRAEPVGPVPALEPFKTKSGATAFKTPEIALAAPRQNVRQPGGTVTRIDYEIRDRRLYAEAIRDGATPEAARDESNVGIITLDVDNTGVFKSLRNIEIFESKRGKALAEKVVGGIMESLPAGAKLHIYDILPKAVGFWDKMGAKFPRSEDFMEANLSPEQFRNAYDTRTRIARTRGQPQESRAATDTGTGIRRFGPDETLAQRAAEQPTGVRNPSTVTRVQAAVTELIGGKQLPNRLGRVVATTASEIKSRWEPILGQNLQIGSEGEAGVAQGFYDPATKTVFLIADHIEQGSEMAVAAHELMHKHGQTVLGTEGWNKLYTVISTWANAEAGSTERAVYDYARGKVEAVGEELSSQEMFPYAVEAAIKMGIKPSLIAKQGTVSRWLGSVKYAMQQAWGKITGKPDTFKTQDLVDLAFGIAQMENPRSAVAMGAALRDTTPSIPKDEFVLGTVKFQPFDTDERAQERMNRATNVEEDYRLPNIGNAVPKDYVPKEASQKTVTIYRGVPAGIVGATIRPGDWVSLKKQYAAEHGTGETGKSKIISMDVPAADVGWAGTDMNEWFYAPKPQFSRIVTQPNLSPWRDETGRLHFAPGAWIYKQIGKAASPMLVRLGMKAATPELRRQLRQMKIDVEKAQEVAVAIARETTKLSEEERAMVSDLVEQELKVGVIPPAHAVKLAAMINDAMGRQTDELVSLDMLTKDSADKWRGKYLPRYYESKLRDKLTKTGATWADALRGLTGRPSVMKGIKGKNLKGRGLYETIPEAELPNYEALGWEVRDPDYTPNFPTVDGTVQVWRDFSLSEREKMGEIRDAGFRFVMGYMQTQRDIALGRMFERMAQDPEQSSRLEKEGYVQVPTTTVSGTGTKVYGKLAGRWVPTETLSQLSNIEENTSETWQMYRKAMGIWKMGKVAMNPVSHVNNMVSNLTMAHLAGISYHRGDKYLAAARDFVKKPAMLQEAKDNGLFLGTMSDAELMNSLPEELRILAQKQESTTLKVARTGFDIMTMFLRKPMGAAYQAEDTFFRYLIYKDAREQGLEPQDAVDYAQKYIFTYDDLPKGARRIRDFGIPFFSYTYKAAPALLHTALTHPLRMAAPAAVLWGINAAAYAIATGDDDDDWQESLQKYLTDPAFRAKAREQEKLEREHLPPWNKGTTALITPKMIRLGMDEVTKLPLFIDVSRIIPGGDMFDVSPNAGGIPLPQPITPSHPLFTTAVAMLGNRDLFRGKDLVDKNDTMSEAAGKRSEWMWTQLSPAVAAGNYYWMRGMNALAQATGKEVTWMPDVLGGDVTGIGKDGLPVQPKYATMQTFGIKVRPMDLETSAAIDKSMQRKLLRDIDAEMSALRRLESKGAVSQRAVDKARALADIKKERIKQGLTVEGEERD